MSKEENDGSLDTSTECDTNTDTINLTDDDPIEIVTNDNECKRCKRSFSTLPGLKRHSRACEKQIKAEVLESIEEDSLTNNEEINSDNLADQDSASADTLFDIFDQDVIPNGNDWISGVDVSQDVPQDESQTDMIVTEESSKQYNPVISQDHVFPGKCDCCGEDVKTAHMTGDYHCEVCNILLTENSLPWHKAVAHDEGDTFTCNECEVLCPDKITLVFHLKLHFPEIIAVAKPKSKQRTPNSKNGKRTVGDRNGTKKSSYPCNVCKQVFRKEDALREHLIAHIDGAERKQQHVCRICSSEFKTLALLNKHKRQIHITGKYYTCVNCDVQLTSIAELKKHKKTHHGQKPFKPVAPSRQTDVRSQIKVTRQTGNERKSTKTVDDVYNFNIELEDEGFKKGRSKRRSARQAAVNTIDEDPQGYFCEFCDRGFPTARGLKCHMRSCEEQIKSEKYDVEMVNLEEKDQDSLENSYAIDKGDECTTGNSVYTVELNSHLNSDTMRGISDYLLDDEDATFSTIKADNSDIANIEIENTGKYNTVTSKGHIYPGRCDCCGENGDTAHMIGEFYCEPCNVLLTKKALPWHKAVVHDEGETFNCSRCEIVCPDKKALRFHLRVHNPHYKPVSCPVCHKEFSRKYHLIRHNMQTGCDGSEKPTFPCQVCQRIFTRKDNLREHLRAHAGQTKRKRQYTCEFCAQDFKGTSALNLHKRLEHLGDKPHGCDMCDKRFATSGALKKHRRRHTGERPYECKQCFAKFSAKETLNRHTRIHTGVKPHVCLFCGKSFIQASQLRAHIFHHTGENGFTCERCGKSFNRRTRLDLHVKYVHEGAKPFDCEKCGKTFVRKEDLARHDILHTGIKAHKCPICSKAFAMKASLKIHLLTHTKEPPRSCDECGRAFIRQDCLLRHMRTKHREMLEEIMAEAEKKKLQAQLLVVAVSAQNAGDSSLRTGYLVDPETGGTPEAQPPTYLTESELTESVEQLLSLLVDESTLASFGWPTASVDKLLESVIKRCGHVAATTDELPYVECLRENAKLLFTVVIDDTAVKTLLNNQTVDEVILHVLKLAKNNA